MHKGSQQRRFTARRAAGSARSELFPTEGSGTPQCALLRDGNALDMARRAVRKLVAIESCAAGQGPDADGDAFPGRHEAFVQQVDVGDAVDLEISNDAA
jgi:hypothetical protein